ncbi:MAG: hypothetical protein GQ470_03475 [Gammaproteobacteria bacterium]|nr:hypothetical protein [Gammaproteobacteria bacterium]
MNQEQQQLINEQLTGTLIKLERDIERHRGERQYHIHRTNLLVKIITLFLLVVGVFNAIYVWEFYDRMQKIVYTISDLRADVTVVSGRMTHLTDTMGKFDSHMNNMLSISRSTQSMSEQIPQMNRSMGQMTGHMGEVNREMMAMNYDVEQINRRFENITHGMGVMGQNVNQISGPMGMFNPIMP